MELTTFNQEKTKRFKGASWYNVNANITIGGVGGIGSWVALLLARTGEHYIHIYDPDIVEIHNLAGQLYSAMHVGMSKISAMVEIIGGLNGIPSISRINGSQSLLDANSRVHEVSISAFDNMQARKDMFSSWEKSLGNMDENQVKKAIFIDGRLEAEQYQVFFVTPDRIELYKKTLFDDSLISDEGACSYKQTSHFAAMIASRMVQGLTNFLGNTLYPDTYEIPFMFQEDGKSFFTEIRDSI